jgi:hypothetical protein
LIAKYEEGFNAEGKSEEYFKKGIELVFPGFKPIPSQIKEGILKDLYRGARCGLYHGGMTSGYISVGGGDYDLHYDPNTRRTVIAPHKLAKTVETHFHQYIERLKDLKNSDLRKKFELRYDFDVGQVSGHIPKK